MKKLFKLISVMLALFMAFTPLVAFAEGEDTEDYGVSSSAQITDNYYILDDGGLLDDSEYENVLEACEEAYEETGVSVYIATSVTVGMSDDYHAYMETISKVFAPEDKVILFVGFKPDDHVYMIDSFGSDRTVEYLSSERLSNVQDKMQEYMVGHYFEDAFITYTKCVTSYMSKDPKFDTIFFKWYFHLIIAVVIAGAVVFANMSSMKTHSGADARTYLDQKNSKVIGAFDRYTHTTTQVIHHEKASSSGGGGGGGGHASSGGRSF